MRNAVTILAIVLAAGPARAADAVGDVEQAEELRDVLLRGGAVPVTAPDDPREQPLKVPLPPEGSRVIDRACRLRPDLRSGWVVLEFIDEPGRRDETSRWALPCERLERMEAVAARRPGVVFRISGETLIHDNRPFLLITKDPVVVSLDGEGSETSAPTTRPATRPGERNTETPEPATQPGERMPTADEIFEAMMRDRPGRPIDPSGYRPAEAVAAPSVAPGGEAVLATDDREVVADRLVRIPRAGPAGWKEVRFRSDNTLRKPPMRLLPCRQLAKAERLGGTLRVSGLVTTYKGRRYLLLRKCIRKRDMGRL
ncbi:MAG: hypothetical protein KGY99_01180 [Phycisphaerae bacterium]|nr:hypothetical protein [Phycisphaerae bacterium]